MIIIPNRYDEYLKFQRTGAEDYLRTKEQVIEDTKYDIEKVLEIKPNGENIVDIGCGLGLMMAHLNDEFKNIHLIDKTGLELNKRVSGTGSIESFGFYTDLEFAEKLVKENTQANVKTFTPDKMPSERYDVIISFYSWGFHYPIDVYSDWAISSLAQDGAIVLTARDIRVNEYITYFRHKGLDAGLIETRQACGLIYARQT